MPFVTLVVDLGSLVVEAFSGGHGGGCVLVMDAVRSFSVDFRSLAETRSRSILLSWIEARPAVQAIFMLRFFSGVMLAAGLVGHADLRHVMIGALAWQLAMVCVYLYNGVSDVHGDRINVSPRPIASGRLALSTARVQVAVYAALAMSMGMEEGLAEFFLVSAMLVLGWLYSAPGVAIKNTTRGAGVIVFLMGLLTYADGFVTIPHAGLVLPLVIVAIAMSLWMGLVGAVVKDFSDPAGDLAGGRRTLVAVRGGRPARIAASVSALGIGACFLAAAEWVPVLLVPAAVTLAGGLTVAALCLVPALSKWATTLMPNLGERALTRLPYRAFMATQYLVHLSLIAPLIQ